MACINTWRCDLIDCCNGYSFEKVPLNFLCDVNIDNYVDPDLGRDMTILWSGDPLVWSGYSAGTKPYSGCFRITYAQQGTWVDGAFAPTPSAWFSGQTPGWFSAQTPVRDSCVSCTTFYPCPPQPLVIPRPCASLTDCFKCRNEDAVTTGQCQPYIYSGCVELRDAQTHWVGRKMYNVSWWLNPVWRAIPTFSPAWSKNVNWQGFNPLPCPSNNGVQYSNEVWYDFGDDVPFGQELPIDPTDWPFSPGWPLPCFGPAYDGMFFDPDGNSRGSVLETWWHIGTHTGNIDMTFDVPDGKYEIPMRIIVFWNDIMFCDSGFIGNITTGYSPFSSSNSQQQITNYWVALNGVWSQYNVGCGYEQDIYEMAPGKFGTCGRNMFARQIPYYNQELTRPKNNCRKLSWNCYAFFPPSYDRSNPGNHALRSHDRRDGWGSVTFADGRTFPQYGAPGQIGVVNDYPRGGVRSTNGRIKLRFNKNLPEPTYCKIFVLRGPHPGDKNLFGYEKDGSDNRIVFKEMICNGLS